MILLIPNKMILLNCAFHYELLANLEEARSANKLGTEHFSGGVSLIPRALPNCF